MGMTYNFLLLVAAVIAALLLNSYIGVSKIFAPKPAAA